MPGIYIHIPFCNSKCYYCDFFSRTIKDEALKEQYVEALCSELKIRKDYLGKCEINSIYFGGGTPSTLSILQIEKILNCIFKYFSLKNNNNEITFEANPENLSVDYIVDLQKLAINRLSIGIQSFFDDDLAFMNRKHTAKQAIESVRNAQKAGFENITIDLIYGLPQMSVERLKDNLSQFFELDIPHLSAYHLTIEENTVFGNWLKKGKIKEIDESRSVELFETLIEQTEKHGYLHYEISNFARKGFISKHNFSYWTGEKYLGVGASAHSYNQISRQWNISNINQYIDKVNKNQIFFDVEELTGIDKFNEYVLTRLRTYNGLSISDMRELFKGYYNQILLKIKEFEQDNLLEITDKSIKLTRKGKLVSDAIMSELIIVR